MFCRRIPVFGRGGPRRDRERGDARLYPHSQPGQSRVRGLLRAEGLLQWSRRRASAGPIEVVRRSFEL